MATKKIDWADVQKKLPYEKNDAQKAKRTAMFKAIDSGNHHLSLAEVDKGIRDVLGLDTVFDCKPAIIRAFTAAKSISNKKSKTPSAHNDDDYITFSEFRLFLLYLRQYFEYYVMFQSMDSSKDGRVSFEEFQKAVPTMQKWGAKIPDPRKAFDSIDKNKGGFILFDEFADYSIKQALDLEDDSD